MPNINNNIDKKCAFASIAVAVLITLTLLFIPHRDSEVDIRKQCKAIKEMAYNMQIPVETTESDKVLFLQYYPGHLQAIFTAVGILHNSKVLIKGYSLEGNDDIKLMDSINSIRNYADSAQYIANYMKKYIKASNPNSGKLYNIMRYISKIDTTLNKINDIQYRQRLIDNRDITIKNQIYSHTSGIMGKELLSQLKELDNIAGEIFTKFEYIKPVDTKTRDLRSRFKNTTAVKVNFTALLKDAAQCICANNISFKGGFKEDIYQQQLKNLEVVHRNIDIAGEILLRAIKPRYSIYSSSSMAFNNMISGFIASAKILKGQYLYKYEKRIMFYQSITDLLRYMEDLRLTLRKIAFAD